MAPRVGWRVLPFLYLVAVSAVIGLFICLGFAVDRLPLLPRGASRAYQRTLLVLVAGLARPSDAWVEPPVDSVAGPVAGESAP